MLDIRTEVISKLLPQRFSAMSVFMASIVGYLVSECYTRPRIVEIAKNEGENLIYFRLENEVGFDHFRSLSDFNQNLTDLMTVAGLSDEERAWIKAKINAIPRVPGSS